MNIKKNKGFTLLELMLVIAVGATITAFAIQQQMREMLESHARGVAGYLNEYVKAVRALSVAAPTAVHGIRNDVNWIKSASCAGGTGPGPAGQGYLPCTFPNDTQWKLGANITTNYSVAGSPVITLDPLVVGGENRVDLTSIIAMLLQNGLVDAGFGTTSVVSLDRNPVSATFGRVTIAVNADGVNDPWIRRDGLNSPTAAISWGNQSLSNISTLGVNGNATVGGTASVNRLNSTTSVNAGTSVSAGTTVNAGTSVSAGTTVTAGDAVAAGTTVSSGSHMLAGGTVSARGNILAQNHCFQDAAGSYVFGPTGLRYSCLNLQDMKKLDETRWVLRGVYRVNNGDWVLKPACTGAGAVQKIVLVPSAEYQQSGATFTAWAENIHASYWRARFVSNWWGGGAGVSGNGLAHVYCFYN